MNSQSIQIVKSIIAICIFTLAIIISGCVSNTSLMEAATKGKYHEASELIKNYDPKYYQEIIAPYIREYWTANDAINFDINLIYKYRDKLPPDYINWKNNSALILSVKKGHFDITRLIINYYINNKLINPIYEIAKHGGMRLLNKIISNGYDIDFKDGNGLTAMDCAFYNNSIETIQNLSALGANPHKPKSGNITIVFDNNARYTGQILNDKYNGQGTLIYSDGSRYSGHWVNDKKNGRGVFINSKGDRLTGIFKDGQCIKCTEQYSDTTQYERAKFEREYKLTQEQSSECVNLIYNHPTRNNTCSEICSQYFPNDLSCGSICCRCWNRLSKPGDGPCR